jgi:uncharacterized protein Yka (UPF0111/DUF47 family)
MLEKLFPKDRRFFELFEASADRVVTGAELLERMLQEPGARPELARQLKSVEHEADGIAHETLRHLHQTFVAPLDRDVIHRLIARLDDVIDAANAAGERLHIFPVGPAPPAALELAAILRAATAQTRQAVGGLRDLKHPQALLDRCVEINRLEDAGDDAVREGLATLFRDEQDLRVLLMWKEICEFVEDAIDRCEDVADVIEGIVLEHA